MIATLLITIGTAAPAPAIDLTLELHAEARVRGLEMTLGDIAEVRGEDQSAVTRARAIALGYAPAPGFRRVLDSARIAQKVMREIPEANINFEGSSRCVILAATTSVTPARVIAAARKSLNERFAGQDVHLEMVGDLSTLEVPEPSQSVELVPELRDAANGTGTWSIPVRVMVDGELYRTLFTNWNVSVWRRQLVLSRAVAAGEVVTRGHMELRRIRVSTGAESRPINEEAYGHAIAVRDLNPGSVVTERDVQRTTVLQRGDTVTLEVRRGGIRARAIAEALSDGRVGDRVRVRCSHTGNELVGIVRSRNLITITL